MSSAARNLLRVFLPLIVLGFGFMAMKKMGSMRKKPDRAPTSTALSYFCRATNLRPSKAADSASSKASK